MPELEDELILYYVYNLNWLLPIDKQTEAMDFLSKLPSNKVGMIIPTYGKECWENGVKVIKKMGFPQNKKALYKLARLLQDRNCPGALDAIEVFREIGKEHSVPYIEEECQIAIKQKNEDWLEHLYYACESLGYSQNDFDDKNAFICMQKIAKELL
ncbi:hypothetical protein P4571_24090 [Niallia alba]|uniref:hypothetical protein n=1 Tax=Niallia alba TaxID=2729105 RepID=UPI002E1D8B2B|nr:hypothetical protein [Niallia alba]